MADLITPGSGDTPGTPDDVHGPDVPYQDGPNPCETSMRHDLLEELAKRPETIDLLRVYTRHQARQAMEAQEEAALEVEETTTTSTEAPEPGEPTITGLPAATETDLEQTAYFKEGDCPTIILQTNEAGEVSSMLAPNGEILRIKPDNKEGTAILFKGLLGFKDKPNAEGEYSEIQVMPRLLNIRARGEEETEVHMRIDNKPDGDVHVSIYVAKGEIDITDFEGNPVGSETAGFMIEIDENLVRQGTPGEEDYNVEVSYDYLQRYRVDQDEDGKLHSTKIDGRYEPDLDLEEGAACLADAADNGAVDAGAHQSADVAVGDGMGNGVSNGHGHGDANGEPHKHDSLPVPQAFGGSDKPVEHVKVVGAPSGGCGVVQFDSIVAANSKGGGAALLLPLLLIAAYRTAQRGLGIKRQIRGYAAKPHGSIVKPEPIGKRIVTENIQQMREEAAQLAENDPTGAEIIESLLDAVEHGRQFRSEDREETLRMQKAAIGVLRVLRESGIGERHREDRKTHGYIPPGGRDRRREPRGTEKGYTPPDRSSRGRKTKFKLIQGPR